jgi:hypothetical protein
MQARRICRKRLGQVSQPSQENTMASAFPALTPFPPTIFDPSDHAAEVAEHAPERKRGLLGRFLDGLIEARHREAEQQVARLLARSGGKFTDSLEREAERAVLGR